ncbi:ferric reductase like transmembrane component-domain-containing protein [Penicillium maclennaniae]|uniref:ferric reductase like transmembrane component-domain-containing protein n=1 Tax=Penicillium maclennaniae TaxID=1343394 RepID=UPI0025408255|nr:ferric reductase like transmembrane component-domain-containing protein [Penicillium maclennaniae]KAJ5662650.1 ferric reductase like transmembrane component-domain-containing protein [Penicillium maclennaniae]
MMSETATNDTLYTGAVSFERAAKASQNAVSYAHQFDYGHYTTWYYLAILGVGIAAHMFCLYRNRKPRKPVNLLGATAHKILALSRSICYRSVGGETAACWGIPRLGMLVFGIFTWLFFLFMTFLVHPYYRERRGYGSPPLAVRTGLMSTALMPVIVALAGKVNLVTCLTGINHEKLNIFHRWASYLCLFLAIVHTVPFIVTPLQTCGADGLRAQFYRPGGSEYTGVPPLGMLVGLAVLSVPIIRHRFYNLFYRIHIPLYIAFLGLLFWHTGNEKDSWAYLWATLAIWLFQNCARLFTKWQTFNVHRNWFSGFSATLQSLPGDTICVTLLVPTDLKWKPGQHCWLRMPHLSALQNHPFTIANLPSGKITKDESDMQEMEFYIRAQRGLTQNLLKSVVNHSDQPVTIHVDGPYGGIVENLPSLYDSLVFVGGGSGISACIPHIMHAAEAVQEGSGVVKSIRLIWMVRHLSHTQWVSKKLKQVSMMMEPDFLHIDFYITGQDRIGEDVPGTESVETVAPQDKDNIPQEEGLKSSSIPEVKTVPDIGIVHYTRPCLPELLPPLLSDRRIFVFGCGPESLTLDLGNAVADSQSRVLRGEADVITLHTEAFGW